MTTLPSVRTLADDLWLLLGGTAGEGFTAGPVNLYRGNVTSTVPVDGDGSVHAYAVLYASGGTIPPARRVGGRPRNLGWSFQVSVVGGDDTRLLWCLDTIRGRLTGKRLGGGVLREVGDPGPLRQDTSITPYRYWLPLDYQLAIVQ